MGKINHNFDIVNAFESLGVFVPFIREDFDKCIL
jgi:hypothetical protein